MTALARTLILAASLAGAAGCASSRSTAEGGESPTPAGAAPARQRKDPNVITEQEIAARPPNLSALQVIEQLRPQFLRVRGPTTLGNAANQDMIWVYVDGTRMGNVSILSNIAATEVREIRYLSPSEATNRYGTGHVQGAILVSRK